MTARKFLLCFFIVISLSMILIENVSAEKITDVNSRNKILLDDQGHIWKWDGFSVDSDGNIFVNKPYVIAGFENVKDISKWDQDFLLRDDGTVWIFNNYPIIENGISTGGYITISEPRIIRGLENISAISANVASVIALKNDGTVWGWGENYYGQLGTDKEYLPDGPLRIVIEPVQVKEIDNITKISMGSSHTVVHKSDGTVWTWGLNSKGQLGIAPIQRIKPESQYTPIMIGMLNHVVDISAGDENTVVLKEDGTVWAWGRNWEGEIGNGIPLEKEISNATPQRVENLTNIVSVTSGQWYTLVLRNDGTVWAWGKNDQATLGDGTTENRNIPVQVKGLENIIAISASMDNACLAVDKDGNVWAWGVGNIQVKPGLRSDKYAQNVSMPIKIISGECLLIDNSSIQEPVATPGLNITATLAPNTTMLPSPTLTPVLNTSSSPSPGPGFELSEIFKICCILFIISLMNKIARR